MDHLTVGQRVKYYRNQKKMSQAVLCGVEDELTVRHLRRIEKDEVAPTTTSLEFLSARLEVPVNVLTGGSVELPERYEFLKHELLKANVYGDKDRVDKEEAFFKEIFDDYFEILPVEEQNFAKLLYDVTRTYTSKSLSIEPTRLKEQFKLTQKKEIFVASDLLVLDLYVRSGFYASIDEKSLDLVGEKLIEQSKTIIGLEGEFLVKLWIVQLNLYEFRGDFYKMEKLLSPLQELMKRTNNLVKKPIVDMLEGKFILFAQKDLVGASNKYQMASQLAYLQEDEFLSGKILEEWEQDKEKFVRK